MAPSATHYLPQSNSLTPGADAAALAPNGDVIAAGEYANSVLTYGTLWAFNSSGGLDTSFGSSGAAVFQDSSGQNTEFAGLAISPVTGDLGAVGDASSVGGSGYSGLGASFVGYGPPKVVTTPALKLALSSLRSSLKARTVSVTSSCNEACSLSATLGISSATAKTLKLGTTTKSCRKVNGKRRCRKVTHYKALTLARASGRLGAAGSKGLTLRISKAVASAIAKHKSVKLTLSVTAVSAATHKSVKSSKSFKFGK
jgi:hypothetical protein